MYPRFLLLVLLSLCAGQTPAQQALRIAASPPSQDSGSPRYYYARLNEAPRAIEFVEGTVTASNFIARINTYLSVPAEFSFRETASNTDRLGMRHRLMQQYYREIPLEGMVYRIHERNGFVVSANGKAMRDIRLDPKTKITEPQAFRIAADHLQTKDTATVNGTLLIVSKDFVFSPQSFSVAYQFDIAVSLIEQWRISVDAKTGEIVNKVSLVHSCFINKSTAFHEAEKRPAPMDASLPLPYVTGRGLTNYYGQRNIRVEQMGNSMRMVGQTEHGGIIGTYNFANVSIISLLWFFQYSKAYDIYSYDGYFDDQPAVSVQWAAEQAYEYYFTKHNRNSFDNNGAPIKSYVHVDVNMDNAYWLGYPKILAFGDGSNNNPLVEIDIVGHELTHGVTQHEAELNYAYEPGALNESFSDIFGKAMEFHVFGDTATWKLARHFRPGGLRDMENPNLKNQPDTYKGDLWFTGYEDAGGVHYNSGVQNFWFYLLSAGGSGVNDSDVPYSVNAIGIDNAAKIAYRNLTEYMGVFSDYFDSRLGSLLATADLFGKNSAIYAEVANAWDAVGVIDEPIISDMELYDITATTVKVRATLIPRGDSVTYHFEYGLTQALGGSTPKYEYVDKVEGIITGLQPDSRYYMRLVATNENGNSYAASEFSTISLAPLVKLKQTVDVTDTTAMLYGEVNPNSLNTSFFFEYGLTPELGLVTSPIQLPDTTEFLDVSTALTGLQPRNTYYYRLKAINASATSTTELASFFSAVKPVITGTSPLTGTAGSEVTISGQNFNEVTENNRVAFGAVKAEVISSSPTEIKVHVPVGASFGPISVLDRESGLAAYSPHEFVPTFEGEFRENDLNLKSGFNDINLYKALVADMDGDDKPDIIATHYQGISVFQNVHQGVEITDESFIRNTFPILNYNSGELELADLDGNGLCDVVVRYQNGIRIYPNLSAPGFVFFGPPVDLSTGFFREIVLSDFDNDGHIDIAALRPVTWESSELKIFRNQNPRGLLAADNFEERHQTIVPSYVYFLTTGDLNNDGTIDLLAGDDYQSTIAILKNHSSPGSFSFDQQMIADPSRGRFVRYITHDFNQDGRNDIVSHSPFSEGSLALHERMESGSEIQLEAPKVILTRNAQPSVAAGDLNGDGRADLMVGLDNRRLILLKNHLEAGEHFSDSSFRNFAEYGLVLTNNGSGTVDPQLSINDLNGDGRPEVIAVYDYNFGPHDGYEMEIWQNFPGDCVDPTLIELEVTRYSASLTLPVGSTLDDFEIEYSYAGSSNWWRVHSTTLSGLNPGYPYQLRVRAKCYLAFTDYRYIDFVTECVDLNSFSITSVGVDWAMIHANDRTMFEVQYSPAGKNSWKTLSEWSTQITGLTPGTTYDIRFRGDCYHLAEYRYDQFTTQCPVPSGIAITEVKYNKAIANWSGTYGVIPLVEYSENLITWYPADEAGNMDGLTPGTRYEVRASTVCTDLHSDVITTWFTTPCPRVEDLRIDAITPFSARISWSDESATGHYTLTYTDSEKNIVRTLEVSANVVALDALTPGTRYSVNVAPHCRASEEYTSETFITDCYRLAIVAVSEITQTAARISWQDQWGDVPYLIDYSIRGRNQWQTSETEATSIHLSDLRPGTEYEVRVHLDCPSITAPYDAMWFQTALYEETAFVPNPTHGKLVIRPTRNLIGSLFNLYDHAGRQVAGGILRDYEIDLTPYAAGLYILRIEGEPPVKIVKY